MGYFQRKENTKKVIHNKMWIMWITMKNLSKVSTTKKYH